MSDIRKLKKGMKELFNILSKLSDIEKRVSMRYNRKKELIVKINAGRIDLI
ncbi:MAG: hypothetical protein V3R52_07465 [Candidatus Neomarinimicrobiota bacterium]